jgi:hypothetical protein
MSSVTATSTGISDMMQMFSSIATPAVSSLLSSSQVQSALPKASPQDIVQLSDQAMQLQETDSLFASPDTAQTYSPGMTMQNLLTSIYTGVPSSSSVNLLA